MVGKISVHFIMMIILLAVLIMKYITVGEVYFNSLISVFVGIVIIARLDYKENKDIK